MKSIILAASEGEEPNPLIPHIPELVLGVVVFGLLFLLVKKFVVPNFEATFAERTSAIVVVPAASTSAGMREVENPAERSTRGATAAGVGVPVVSGSSFSAGLVDVFF